MTLEQHLLENAIKCLEEQKTGNQIDTLDYNQAFLTFAEQAHNQAMAEVAKISLTQVWSMATYVVYTLKADWEENNNDLGVIICLTK